jgi:hypothetical protein
MSLLPYLAALRAQLAGDRPDCDDLIEELRTHLEECAHDLQLQGLSVAESEREALHRFGPPADLAAAFAAQRRSPAPFLGAMSFRARGAGLAAMLALGLAGTVGGGIAAASLGAVHASTPVVRHEHRAPAATRFAVGRGHAAQRSLARSAR